jgi:thiol-activated cytolysin
MTRLIGIAALSLVFFVSPRLNAQATQEPEGEEVPAKPAADEEEKPADAPEEKSPAAEEETDKETTVATDNAENGPAIREYISGLEYNPYLLLAVQGDGTVKVDDKPIGAPNKTEEADDSGKITTCTRTTHSLKANFENVAIVQPTQGIIYPGALIKVNKAMLDGQPEAIQDLKRGPLTLRLKLPGVGSEGNLKIDEPSDGTVETAINHALDVWTSNNNTPESYKNASRSNYEVTEAFSSDQLAVKLGASVGYMSLSASAGFGFSSSNEKRTVIAIYKQIFYTVSFDPPNGFTADKFFDPSVTLDEAKAAFDNKSPIGYVADESWGRLLMFKMETSKNTSSVDAEAALKFGIGALNVGVESKNNYEKILSNSQINVITLGGNAAVSSTANSAKSADDLRAIIEGENAIFSKNNPGSPIGYTIKFVKNNGIAKMGSTTEYTATECNVFESRFVRVENGGAFAINQFILSYDIGKKAEQCKNKPQDGTSERNEFNKKCDRNNPEYKPDVVLEHGGGGAWKWEVPGNATNVKLVGNVMAGYQRVKWLDDPKTDFNVCYFTTGTTLSSSEFEKRIKGQSGCN